MWLGQLTVNLAVDRRRQTLNQTNKAKKKKKKKKKVRRIAP